MQAELPLSGEVLLVPQVLCDWCGKPGAYSRFYGSVACEGCDYDREARVAAWLTRISGIRRKICLRQGIPFEE